VNYLDCGQFFFTNGPLLVAWKLSLTQAGLAQRRSRQGLALSLSLTQGTLPTGNETSEQLSHKTFTKARPYAAAPSGPARALLCYRYTCFLHYFALFGGLGLNR
jgi:hypothetical protein